MVAHTFLLISIFIICAIITVKAEIDISERKKVIFMRASTKNMIMGRFCRMNGNVKVTVGKGLNWRRLWFNGHMDRLNGMVRMNFGRMERVFGW
jgi:hypothetical protein